MKCLSSYNTPVNLIGLNEHLENNVYLSDFDNNYQNNLNHFQKEANSPRNSTSNYFCYFSNESPNHSFYDSNKKKTNFINRSPVSSINDNINFTNFNYYSYNNPKKNRIFQSENKSTKYKCFANHLHNRNDKIECRHSANVSKYINNRTINEKNNINKYTTDMKTLDNIMLNTNKNNYHNILTNGFEQKYSRNNNIKYNRNYNQNNSSDNYTIEGLTETFSIHNNSHLKYFYPNIILNNLKQKSLLDSNNENIVNNRKKVEISPEIRYIHKEQRYINKKNSLKFTEINQKNINKAENINKKITKINHIKRNYPLDNKKTNNEEKKNNYNINDIIGTNHRKYAHNHQFKVSVEKKKKIKYNTKKINSNNKINENDISDNNKDNYKIIKINNKKINNKIIEINNNNNKCNSLQLDYNYSPKNYSKLIIQKNNQLKQTNSNNKINSTKKINKIIIVRNQKPQFDLYEKNKSTLKTFDIDHYELNYPGSVRNIKTKLKNSKISESSKEINNLQNSLKSRNDADKNELKSTNSATIVLYPTKTKPKNFCSYNRTKYLYSENLKFKE